MYGKLPNLVLGFHGCDKEIFDKVLRQDIPLGNSTNEYDWLGNGIYFWEQNVDRAWDWAKEQKSRNKIKEIAVVGAVIDLGFCLNLFDKKYIDEVKGSYEEFKLIRLIINEPMPENKNVKSNTDLLLRNLDCAVIEYLHKKRKENFRPAFDSVRGLFREGKELYSNSGFYEKTHIQICVRNPNCIKGYFNPINANIDFEIP